MILRQPRALLIAKPPKGGGAEPWGYSGRRRHARQVASVSKQISGWIPRPAGAALRREAGVKFEKVDLKSGRWRGEIETTAAGDFLELVQVGRLSDKMRLQLPDGWREKAPKELIELARRPEVRLWTDDARILWRVSAVGPGTWYPYPLRTRHLVFDSDQTWAGVVEFDESVHLGDLTDLDLQGLRDRMCDFGGRRRGYRRPQARPQRTAGAASQ
jgi:hypothetical protein